MPHAAALGSGCTDRNQTWHRSAAAPADLPRGVVGKTYNSTHPRLSRDLAVARLTCKINRLPSRTSWQARFLLDIHEGAVSSTQRASQARPQVARGSMCGAGSSLCACTGNVDCDDRDDRAGTWSSLLRVLRTDRLRRASTSDLRKGGSYFCLCFFRAQLGRLMKRSH